MLPDRTTDLPTRASLDAPKTDHKDDLLGRRGFAKLVADAIASPLAEGGTTFALCGRWGSGKTTVANFVAAELKERATVVRFEPWMVGTSEALVRELFVEIAKHALGANDSKEDRERRSNYWKYVASILSVVKTTGKVLDKAGMPVVGLVAVGAEHVGEVAKVTSEGLEAEAKADTLREARTKLKDDLAKAAKGSLPIVMIIDDVDRLEDEEIRTLFRMVRACADFPNVRYLLLFDRRQVARALAPKGGEDGDEFVEKIVNVAFDLPADNAQMRKSVLLEGIAPIVSLAKDEGAKVRVDELVDKALAKSLGTLRAVKRYAAAAQALGLGMADEAGANYDPADFLALEFLRSEHPEVYAVMLDYEFNVMEALLKKHDPDAPVGSPWLRRLNVAIEATGAGKDIVKDVVQRLRPDLDFASGEQKGVSRGFEDRSNRFFDPAWQPVYVGFDKGRAAFGEEAWNRFVKQLTAQDGPVRLPREFTRDPYPGLVGRTIMFRLQALSDHALVRLLSALLRWGERRLEIEHRNAKRKSQRGASAVWLAQAVLDEIWMRGRDAAEVLDALASETEATTMRVVLLDNAYSTAKHRFRDVWTARESLDERVQGIARTVEELQRSKGIWKAKGASQLISLWYQVAGREVTDAWWSAMYDDPDLLASFLEYELEEPEGENAITSGPHLSMTAQKIAAADTDRLGPRGRRIQAEYQRLIAAYKARMLRIERMR